MDPYFSTIWGINMVKVESAKIRPDDFTWTPIFQPSGAKIWWKLKVRKFDQSILHEPLFFNHLGQKHAESWNSTFLRVRGPESWLFQPLSTFQPHSAKKWLKVDSFPPDMLVFLQLAGKLVKTCFKPVFRDFGQTGFKTHLFNYTL